MDTPPIDRLAAIDLEMSIAMRNTLVNLDEICAVIPGDLQAKVMPSLKKVFSEGNESGLRLLSYVSTRMGPQFLRDSELLPILAPETGFYNESITVLTIHMYRLVSTISVYALVGAMMDRLLGVETDIFKHVDQQIYSYASDVENARGIMIGAGILLLAMLKNGSITRDSFYGKWL